MKNFWWSGITKKVKKYIKEYNICQRNKKYIKTPVEKLMSNTIPEKPWCQGDQSRVTLKEFSDILSPKYNYTYLQKNSQELG